VAHNVHTGLSQVYFIGPVWWQLVSHKSRHQQKYTAPNKECDMWCPNRIHRNLITGVAYLQNNIIKYYWLVAEPKQGAGRQSQPLVPYESLCKYIEMNLWELAIHLNILRIAKRYVAIIFIAVCYVNSRYLFWVYKCGV